MAVSAGSPVTYSSYWQCKHLDGCDHVNYRLDFKRGSRWQPEAWAPSENKGSWIQVSTDSLRYWAAVIMQGRGNADSWVTKIKVSYTKNGK